MAGHPGRAGDRLPQPAGPGRGGHRARRAPRGLCALGDRGTEHACRRIAYRLDPSAFTGGPPRRSPSGGSASRPAPETMCLLTGLLPVAQGVAVHAALTRHADTLRAGGDTRGRGQIMADTLVERVTGQAIAGAVPVEVQLVMTDATLLGQDPTPAHLHGYGPVPAPLVRAWLADTTRRGVAAPALHPPPDRGAGRDGLHPPRLHRRAAPVPHPPGPDLPHPLVRRPDPPPRPLRSARRRRPHQRRQQPRTLRRLQPRQGSPRLARCPAATAPSTPTPPPATTTSAPSPEAPSPDHHTHADSQTDSDPTARPGRPQPPTLTLTPRDPP